MEEKMKSLWYWNKYSKDWTECVKKTDDRGLYDTVKRAVNKKLSIERKAKEAARILRMSGLLKNEKVCNVLKTYPHPAKYWAVREKTLVDWAQWMFINAGNRGKIQVCRTVEKIIDKR
jgi:hypothetical protein